MSESQLKKAMNISDSLAKLNKQRFDQFYQQDQLLAVAAFDGDAFVELKRGLPDGEFSLEQLDYLRQHLRILSGLYGVIEPTNAIRPYRLEMGCKKLGDNVPRSLVDFWGNDIKDELMHSARAASPNPVVVNVASQEYAAAAKCQELSQSVRVVDVHFKAHAPIYAKKARGAIVRYAMDNALDDPSQLKHFTGPDDEWHFDEEQSSDSQLVFVREKQPAKPSSQKTSTKQEQSDEAQEAGKARTQPERNKRKASAARHAGFDTHDDTDEEQEEMKHAKHDEREARKVSKGTRSRPQ